MKMNKNYFNFITVFLFSAITSILIVSDIVYFPYAGFAFLFAGAGTLAFYHRRPRTSYSISLYILILLLSSSLIIWASPSVTSLNLFALFFLLSYLVADKGTLNVIDFFVMPLKAFISSLAVQNRLFHKITLPKIEKEIDPKKAFKLLGTIFFTFLLLIVVVPLLASANPIFSNYIEKALSLIDLEALFELLAEINVFIWISRIAFFFPIFYASIKALSLVLKVEHKELPSLPHKSHIHFELPKVMLALVLLLFFVSQAQLYFASENYLAEIGFSHSSRTNEIYGQLTVVAAITYILMFFDKSKKKLNKNMTYVLTLMAVFLTLIALNSDLSYMSNWGFTHKRLWGLVMVVWVLSMLSVFVYKYYKNYGDSYVLRRGIIITGALLFVVNVANFDYLIFHYAKSTTHEGLDHQYMSRLSTDAESYEVHLEQMYEMLYNQYLNDPYFFDGELYWSYARVLNKARNAASDNSSKSLGTFNLSRLKAKKATENIDFSKHTEFSFQYEEIMRNKRNTPKPTPINTY